MTSPLSCTTTLHIILYLILCHLPLHSLLLHTTTQHDIRSFHFRTYVETGYLLMFYLPRQSSFRCRGCIVPYHILLAMYDSTIIVLSIYLPYLLVLHTTYLLLPTIPLSLATYTNKANPPLFLFAFSTSLSHLHLSTMSQKEVLGKESSEYGKGLLSLEAIPLTNKQISNNLTRAHKIQT